MGVYVFGGIYTLNLIDILLEKPFTSLPCPHKLDQS